MRTFYDNSILCLSLNCGLLIIYLLYQYIIISRILYKVFNLLIIKHLNVNKPLKRTFLGISDFFGKHLGLFWEFQTFLGRHLGLFWEFQTFLGKLFRTFLGRKCGI